MDKLKLWMYSRSLRFWAIVDIILWSIVIVLAVMVALGKEV